MTKPREPASPAAMERLSMVPGIHVQHGGHAYRITMRTVARYLWTTASIDVTVDGKTVLMTGGQAAATGSSERKFVVDGETHTVRLHWDAYAGGGFPCTLYVDDVQVAQRTVSLERSSWLVPFVLIATAIGAGMVAFFNAS